MKQAQLPLLCSSWLGTLMLFWMLLLVHHVLQQPNGCFACVEEERISLLDIKATFTDQDGMAKPYSIFESSNNISTECCSWHGVHCSPNTKHISGLDLSSAWREGYDNTLNVSLFLPFRQLRSLILSQNGFNRCIPNDCFGVLAELDNLRHLDLSSNNFYSINVTNATLKLSKLKYLDLSHNRLNESIIPYLVGLSSLKTLYLDENNIHGGLPLRGLCEIKSLKELSVGGNSLSGDIPLCLQCLSSLSYFDISYNQFQTAFPLTIIKNLTKLKYALFSNNFFRGVVSIGEFANNTELKVLDFSNNNQLEVQFEHVGLFPTFQLEGIFLSNCIINNKGSSSTLMFLSTQYQIKHIDLSNNDLKGNIPMRLFQNKTHLYYLNLRNNSLTGPLIFPSPLKTNLTWFDVSNNKLIGEIPTRIGNVMPSIRYLNMSDNSLQGVIPFSFGNLSYLTTLDLSKNMLSGQISNSIEYLDNLVMLDLSENNFQGNISKNNSNLPNYLFSFIVNKNQLTGEIPSSVCKNVGLLILDVSENQLSGELPSCISNLYSLLVFHVGGNSLEGSIPFEFCGFNALQSLDLSDNNFSDSLPNCFYLQNLWYLNLKGNNFTGPFPLAFFNSSLEILDMANNHFIGDIPNWIGTLLNLKIISLKGNHFKRPIPKQICNLKYLQILDFSQNNLFEDIPACIQTMGRNLSSYTFSGGFGDGIRVLTTPDTMNHFSYMPFAEARLSMPIQYIDFTTKYRLYAYKAISINYLSGLDLSSNKLVGQIPMEIGNMTWLKALNLSNNLLFGPIPSTLSRLTEIESLDLSHNMLEGSIPSQLTELHFLSSFSVAYNNLSGPTLGMAAQFSTFDDKSYEGNPYLCGPPLVKSCNNVSSPPQNQVRDDHRNEETMERLITIAIFALSFIMGFWGWMALLIFKRRWCYSFFLTVDGYMDDIVDMVGSLLAKIKSCW